LVIGGANKEDLMEEKIGYYKLTIQEIMEIINYVQKRKASFKRDNMQEKVEKLITTFDKDKNKFIIPALVEQLFYFVVPEDVFMSRRTIKFLRDAIRFDRFSNEDLIAFEDAVNNFDLSEAYNVRDGLDGNATKLLMFRALIDIEKEIRGMPLL
jgi:hypothetical protein